jgi:hypothetical protein
MAFKIKTDQAKTYKTYANDFTRRKTSKARGGLASLISNH